MTALDDLTASLEDYLETIYHIIEEKQAARVKDISARLGVQNASVTGALKSLAKKGVINYAPYDVITLTPSGKAKALDVIRRHEVMKRFIVDILCLEDNEKAEDAACRMEHTVPPEVLERIIRLVEFTQICPRSGTEWIAGFKRFCTGNFRAYPCQTDQSACVGSFIHSPEQCTMLSRDTIRLCDVHEGKMARLVRVDADNAAIRSQFETLGITPGSLFHVEHITPGNQDMDVGVRGYHLTIRKHDAQKIQVSAC